MSITITVPDLPPGYELRGATEAEIPAITVINEGIFHQPREFFVARYRNYPGAMAEHSRIVLYDGRPVSHLSTGLRRRLVLARALLNDPSIVILDEPTRGLDKESRGRYIEKLQQLKAAGATLILATHDLEKAGALCDRAVLMDGGRIRALGSLSEVVAAGAGLATASPPVSEAPCPA